MYPNIHSTTIYNSQDMEANLSVDRWMDKEDVYIYVYLCVCVCVCVCMQTLYGPSTDYSLAVAKGLA